MLGEIPDRTRTLRMVLRSLNGTVRVLTSLDRDPPIVEMAHLQMTGIFGKNGLKDLEAELMQLLSHVNEYRSAYWKLERSIMQAFLSYMRRKRYLPSSSLEINSLKRGLPEAMIKGDSRIWIYSYDQYIKTISGMVGKKPELAPEGSEVFRDLDRVYSRDIKRIVGIINELLPEILMLISKVRSYIRSPDREWMDIRVKRPKVKLVSRPVRKTVLIKRLLPLPKTVKLPRRRVLKRPEHRIVGPERVK
ncbi:MAG: hypothetical protein ACMUFK_02815 [Thermoplasmatota archaeon]